MICFLSVKTSVGDDYFGVFQAVSLVCNTGSGRGPHLRTMQNPVLRLLTALQFSAEAPFAHLYRTLRAEGTLNRPVQVSIIREILLTKCAWFRIHFSLAGP